MLKDGIKATYTLNLYFVLIKMLAVLTYLIALQSLLDPTNLDKFTCYFDDAYQVATDDARAVNDTNRTVDMVTSLPMDVESRSVICEWSQSVNEVTLELRTKDGYRVTIEIRKVDYTVGLVSRAFAISSESICFDDTEKDAISHLTLSFNYPFVRLRYNFIPITKNRTYRCYWGNLKDLNTLSYVRDTV